MRYRRGGRRRFGRARVFRGGRRRMGRRGRAGSLGRRGIRIGYRM